jgi:hypothetical protein
LTLDSVVTQDHRRQDEQASKIDCYA